MMYVFLLVGFLLLIKGADCFVEGSSSIARLLKVPSVIIGLTIVAMGTARRKPPFPLPPDFPGITPSP